MNYYIYRIDGIIQKRRVMKDLFDVLREPKHCDCNKEQIDELREKQMAAGERVRYDGRCRSRTESRDGVSPVVRFKNPLDGKVVLRILLNAPMLRRWRVSARPTP